MYGLLSLLALPGLSVLPALSVQSPAIEPERGDRWMSGSYEPLGAASLKEGEACMVLPLVTRSERVTRAVLEEGRVVIWLRPSRDISLRFRTLAWVRHRSDERVLGTGTGWWVVGEAMVPTAVAGCDPELLFRQDGFGSVLGPDAVLTPPDGALGQYAIPVAAGRARVGGIEAALDLGSMGSVDQVGYTKSAPSEALLELIQEVRVIHGARLSEYGSLEVGSEGKWVQQDAEGLLGESGAIEAAAGTVLAFMVAAPEETAAGETWSLVVDYGLMIEPGAPAVDASATKDRELQLLEPAALDRVFLHQEGPDLQMDIRPTMGPGAAWGDVNGDGAMDLYLVQGSGRESGPVLRNRLLLGDGNGGFVDGTGEAGVGDSAAGMGALFFDAEGDGDLDLFVANYGKDLLYLNDGAGRFEDASEEAGLELALWSASAAAADYDGDGDLDLYVTAYLDYDPAKMPPAAELDRYQRDDPIEMLPFAFPGERNALYRNESGPDGVRFVEVAEELGVSNPEGLSMQALWWDFDRDGDQDLYVANDVSFNVLYRNDGGTFTDITFAVGLDDPRGGMGLEAGDVDRDGDEDVLLTNWELDTNALYLNNAVRARSGKTRRARFHDGTVAAGLGQPSIGRTSWSPVLFDLDLDGDLDLYVANGYTSPDYQSTGICVGQRDDLFRNDGRGRFRPAHQAAAAAMTDAYVSRAAVPCDYDSDGDIDLIVTANNGPASLFRGRAADLGLGAWLGLRLQGGGKNPFGVGAEVTVMLGEERKPLRRSLRAGSGYLGGGPPELHFGLGKNVPARVGVQVRWPGGKVTEHQVEPNGWRTLEQGE